MGFCVNCAGICTIIAVAFAILMQLYSVAVYEILGNTIDEYGNEWLERGYLPDALIRIGVRLSLKQRLNELEEQFDGEKARVAIASFVKDLKSRKVIAESTTSANEQHYEIDTSFYEPILGFYKKYSSTLYLSDTEKKEEIYAKKPEISLQEAYFMLNESEIDMLTLYMKRADLCSGEKCKLNVLDLGCGWGSFSLFYAKQCPNCNIISISNSQSQIDYINDKATEYGYKNLKAMKQNVNTLDKFAKKIEYKFDRIISIEMFEHMKNYETLLNNLQKMVNCETGKLFVHMFVHKDKPYHFTSGWMEKYFFTGGTMISHTLLGAFGEDFQLKGSWMVNGVHYSYTLETWLHLMDVNENEVKKAIGNIYGNDEKTITKWWYLWRTFFIACSELFKYNDGTEWFVGHYLLNPKC